MSLKNIATVSGKSGLFKIVKPIRNGVLLETLDNNKTRFIAGASSKVSVLQEVSVYTTGKSSSISFEKVLQSIHDKFNGTLDFDPKTASNHELHKKMMYVLPEYDSEKVYASDIKKIFSWYLILVNHCPELFTQEEIKNDKTDVTDSEKSEQIDINDKVSKKKKSKIESNSVESVEGVEKKVKKPKQSSNSKNASTKSLPSKKEN
jgi:hypothetical protein